MPAYRFAICAVGFGDTPDEAFAFVLEHITKNTHLTIDREVEFAEIEDKQEIQHTLDRLLSLHEAES